MQESLMYDIYKKNLSIRFIILIINFLCLIGGYIFQENSSLHTVSSVIFWLGTVAFFYFTGWLYGYRKLENKKEK